MPLPMTLNDVEGHLPLAGLIKWNETPKGTDGCESTSFEPLSVKIAPEP